jgi:hypothetical protein
MRLGWIFVVLGGLHAFGVDFCCFRWCTCVWDGSLLFKVVYMRLGWTVVIFSKTGGVHALGMDRSQNKDEIFMKMGGVHAFEMDRSQNKDEIFTKMGGVHAFGMDRSQNKDEILTKMGGVHAFGIDW